MTFCTRCGAPLTGVLKFCGSCGAAVAGPPAAPAQSQAQGAETAPAFLPGSEDARSSATLPQPAAPWAGAPSSPTGRRRGVLAAAGGIAALAVLGGVGYVVHDRLTGPSGGAETPQAAVLELAAAASAEDVVTALSLLPPEEVGPMVDLYREAQRTATETGFAEEGDPLSALDLRFDGVTTDVEVLSDDVAAVTLTGGTVSSSVDPEALPEPLRIDANGEPVRPASASSDLTELRSAQGQPLRLMTLRHEGKWFVSPLYTALEAWRVDQGFPQPDFRTPLDLDGTGSDSAEGAVREAAGAAAAYDVEALLDLVSPEEAGAVHRYRGVITAALTRENVVGQLREGGTAALDSIEVRAGQEGSAGYVPVTVRSARGSFVDPYEGTTTWSLDRSCVTYGGPGGSGTGCARDVLAGQGLTAAVGDAFDDIVVLTTEHDGRWYVSPVATLVSQGRELVSTLDRDTIALALSKPQFGAVDGTLEPGGAVSGDLATGEYDLYEIDLPADAAVTACASGDDVYSSSFYGPTGIPVGAVIETAGVYRVYVSGTGSYQLETSLGPVQDAPVPSELPAYDGTCGNAVYRVQATAGQPLLLETDSGGFTSLVTGPDGEYEAANGVFVPEQTGTYLLYVAEEAVRVSPLPDDVLTSGASVEGVVTDGGGVTYRLFATAGTTVDLRVYGAGLDGYLTLADPSGVELDTADDTYGRDPGIVWTVDRSGLYTVRVSGYNGSTGSFMLATS